MLTINKLSVSVEGKEILYDISLSIKSGEVHAIMGPNGSGKSSLAFSLMGKSSYKIQVTRYKLPSLRPDGHRDYGGRSKIILDGVDITNKSPEERARLGLFLSFQSPVAIPGVSVKKLLRSLITNYKLQITNKKFRPKTKDQRQKTITDIVETYKRIDTLADELNIKPELLNRSLNDEFSGGEKKKIEMLQMLFLKPKYAIIDEIDTGLDVDALKTVALAIKKLQKSGTGVLIITHYNRILHYIKPDRVHIMMGGRIVKEGGAELAKDIEKKGYSAISDQ